MKTGLCSIRLALKNDAVCQFGKESGREIALIGKVVHGEDARHRGAVRPQIGRGEPGMPIVAMHDVGPPVGVGALRQRGGHPAQEGEAAMVKSPLGLPTTRVWDIVLGKISASPMYSAEMVLAPNAGGWNETDCVEGADAMNAPLNR